MTVGINFAIISAFSLLPHMVKDYFGGNAIHLSWVESAMGESTILGGVLLNLWGGFLRKILTSMNGLTGIGVSAQIYHWRRHHQSRLRFAPCCWLAL